ncbi:MAG: beta strand repeat-containing protein, partial [Opitutaceae bacterium]
SLGTSTVFPYSAVWTPTAVGSYTLSALVTDSFGNIGGSSNVRVAINAAPSVGITSPTASSALTAGVATTLNASASASNPGATIASVQFYVNGAAQDAADTTAPYSVAWTPPAAGAYTLTAVATDSVGTQATSASVSVTVTVPGGGGGGAGPTLPVVALVSPANGASVAVNATHSLVATASLAGGSIASIAYQANGVAVGSASIYPFVVDWKPTSPGSYSLTATATGSNGASATSAANVVTVSAGTAPNVAIATPPSNATISAGTDQAVVVSASATTGAITAVELFANGVSVGVDQSFPYNFSWKPAGVGTVVLTAVATDSQGNRTPSAAVTITVAAVSAGAPSVSVTSPAAGAALPVGVPVSFAAAAADADGTVAQVEFFANGVSLATDSTYPYGVTFTPNATGTYVLTARATDNGGNVSTSAPLSVVVSGGTAPAVAIETPANNATIGVNAPLNLRATATSVSGFITGVQFLVNGVSLSTDTAFPYTATWTPAATGNYALTARATDNLGNVTESAIVAVTVGASAAPTVTVTNPANGSAFVVGTTLTLTADAADIDGTVASVQFLVNGLPLGAPDATAPYSAPWAPGAAGAYTITAQATDNNGNIGTSAAVTVTIGSNAAPTVALTSPSVGAYALGNTVLVAAAANDADGKVTAVQFFANGLSIGSASAAPYTVAWRPPLAGNYALTAQATDSAGLSSSTAATINVRVDGNRPPTVALSSPPAGTSVNSGA